MPKYTNNPVVSDCTKVNAPAVQGEGSLNEGVRGISHNGHGAVVGVNDWSPSGPPGAGGNGGWFESTQGEGVRGTAKNPYHGGVVGVNTAKGVAVFGTSNGEGVHGETTSNTWVAGVTGIAMNQDGIGPGIQGVSKGSGPGVFGQSNKDAGVTGFHGDPRLQETTAGSEGARAGVFGASDIGAGVLGYARSNGSAAVVALGGVRASAMTYPFAGEFFGKVQINGDLQVGGDIFLPGADCAEYFDIMNAEQIEAGAVVVIHQEGSLRQSQEAYDRKVAGVISSAGHYRPGIVLDKQETQIGRRPVALAGKVYCKVDAQYGPIEVGDLLTSSPTAGCAMKASDPSRAFGAVIGKALCPLLAGQGLIPIMVALQ